jgi:F-type H+-transporting ATPase subunit gamma
MRRAQDRMKMSRPYSQKIIDMLSNVMSTQPEYVPKLMRNPSRIKKVVVIVISTDKGLCGGLNTNVFRVLVNKLKVYEQQGIQTYMSVFGNKGLSFLDRLDLPVLTKFVHMGDSPSLDQIFAAASPVIALFEAGEIDRVDICYSKFINTMRQEAIIEQLLPVVPGDLPNKESKKEHKYSFSYMYEPKDVSVIDDMMFRYVDSVIYQSILDSLASEQSARMVAMKAASDNAKDILSSLQLTYNKLRQASITRELSEIVGGAAAV